MSLVPPSLDQLQSFNSSSGLWVLQCSIITVLTATVYTMFILGKFEPMTSSNDSTNHNCLVCLCSAFHVWVGCVFTVYLYNKDKLGTLQDSNKR